MLLTKGAPRRTPTLTFPYRGTHLRRPSVASSPFPSPLSPKCWLSNEAAAATQKKLKPFTEIPGYRSIEEYMADGGPTQLKDLQVNAHRKFGDISYNNLFGFPEITVFNPEDLHKVFRAEGKYPQGLGVVLPVFAEIIKQGNHKPSLVNMVGEEWKRVRTALQKNLFAPEEAETYIPLVNEVARDISKVFPTFAHNCHDLFPKATFELMGNVLFAKRMGALEPNQSEFAKKYMEKAFEATATLEKVMYWHGAPDPKIKQQMFDSFDYVFHAGGDMAKETAERLKTNPQSVSGSYIGQVMKREDLNFDEVKSNVAGFLFAGVDTTSTTMIWLIYNLASNPQVQETLAKELKQVLQGRDLNAKDLPKLEYLRATIKENFRRNPTALATIRVLDQPIEIKGYEIPPGVPIFIAPFAYGVKESIFEDPLKFNPGRWDKSLKEKRIASGNTLHDHPLTVLPFSRGSRMCIGARLAEFELMGILARLFQDWKVEVDPSSPPEKYMSLLASRLVSNPKYIITPRI